jgi:hypothetical protein
VAGRRERARRDGLRPIDAQRDQDHRECDGGGGRYAGHEHPLLRRDRDQPARTRGGDRRQGRSHFRDVDYGTVKNVSFFSFADEGLLADLACTACNFEGLLAVQCVLNRARATKIGAIDIDGTDHWVDRIEAGISGSNEGTVQSVNLYCVAVYWRASTSWVSGIGAELSDIGMYVTGSYNTFNACRGDLNYGHGWDLNGSVNRLNHCFGLDNSQDTTNTYSNFRNEAAALFNIYTGCLAYDLNAKKAKYGFEDLVSTGNGQESIRQLPVRRPPSRRNISIKTRRERLYLPAGTSKR